MTEKLCWIEDEFVDFKTHVHHITKAGYKVDNLSSFAQAKKKFDDQEGQDWPYILTIFDINLRPAPGETLTEEQARVAGVDLLVLFRAKFPKKECIVVSNILDVLEEADKQKIKGIRCIDKLDLRIHTIPDILNKLSASHST